MLQLTFRLVLAFISFLIVAFGQPVFSSFFSLLSALLGYALFFISIESVSLKKKRFFLATGWFTAITLFQYSWALSHPFNYIYFPWVLLSLIYGAQFGVLAALINNESLKKIPSILCFAALWTIFEWSRLFLLSGFTWNPAGLAITGNLFGLQMASLGGVFALSFWVMFTNLLGVRAYLTRFRAKTVALFMAAALFPYFFGGVHLFLHEQAFKKEMANENPLKVLLIQTGFQVEDELGGRNYLQTLKLAVSKWKSILTLLKHTSEKAELIVLPEYVVPLGTFYPVFPKEFVDKEFIKVFGEKVKTSFPPRALHLVASFDEEGKAVDFVNNAYWLQTIANIFNAQVIAGLEDTDQEAGLPPQIYTTATVFFPFEERIERYAKRVLVPMGEYIPGEFFKGLASSYGVAGSFTPGDEAKVIDHPKMCFGLSVCYEETYGHLMRDNRVKGAELLVNITNDFWYPHSKLIQQHFDHSRLRTVEMGIPLVRATNTGVTGAVDSLGRIISVFKPEVDESERVSGALFVEVPRYHYQTLYTRFGDFGILTLSCFFLILPFLLKRLF